jgi:hypothetical protein
MQCEPVTGRNSPAMTRTTAARVGASPLRGPQQLVSRRLAVLAAAVLLLTTPTGTIIPTVRAALTNFTFVDRHYYPAGYKDGTTSGIPDLCVPFHSFMFHSHSLSVCACVCVCVVCVCVVLAPSLHFVLRRCVLWSSFGFYFFVLCCCCCDASSCHVWHVVEFNTITHSRCAFWGASFSSTRRKEKTMRSSQHFLCDRAH